MLSEKQQNTQKNRSLDAKNEKKAENENESEKRIPTNDWHLIDKVSEINHLFSPFNLFSQKRF